MGFLVFVLGLCCGSFINMLVFRTAEKYKLAESGKNKQNKRSFCDFCGRQLEWYENIPVISWTVQGGRSKCCGKRLSVAYPIVELAVGLLFVFNFYFFDFKISGEMILGLVVITMLVFAAVFDIKHMILPDFSTGILIVVTVIRLIILGFGGNFGQVELSLVSAAGGAGFLLVLYWLTKGKGMGMGDVKLAVFMGLWLGWPKIVVAFYVAFVVGAVVGGVLMLVKKLKRKSLIAFGPFLILGTLVAWWWGEKIIKLLNY